MPIKENPKKTFFIFLFFKFWNCPWILSRLISKSVKNHHHHLLQLLIFTLFLSEKGLNSSKKYAFLNFISPNSKKPTNQIKKNPGFNFRYKNSTFTPNKFIKTDFLLGQHTYKHRHVGVREQIWEFQHFTFKSKLKNTKYPDHQIE